MMVVINGIFIIFKVIVQLFIAVFILIIITIYGLSQIMVKYFVRQIWGKIGIPNMDLAAGDIHIYITPIIPLDSQ